MLLIIYLHAAYVAASCSFSSFFTPLSLSLSLALCLSFSVSCRRSQVAVSEIISDNVHPGRGRCPRQPTCTNDFLFYIVELTARRAACGRYHLSSLIYRKCVRRFLYTLDLTVFFVVSSIFNLFVSYCCYYYYCIITIIIIVLLSTYDDIDSLSLLI